jgi:hypothetical protein
MSHCKTKAFPRLLCSVPVFLYPVGFLFMNYLNIILGHLFYIFTFTFSVSLLFPTAALNRVHNTCIVDVHPSRGCLSNLQALRCFFRCVSNRH